MATAKDAGMGVKVPWWLVLVEGILAIIVGLMLLVWPVKAFTTLVFFLGIWWLIDGIFDIVSLIIDRTNWVWKLVMGIIGIIAGAFLIQAPLQGALVLAPTTVIIIGVMGILYGVMGLVNAFQGAGWGAGLIGAISILLGIYLLANTWAVALAVPTVFGILAIAGGFFAIIFAFRMK